MSEPNTSKIPAVAGRAIAVRGDDIDTDRIIPARFLRCVTFDGLEAHAFEDDRRDLDGKVTGEHPFDDPRFQGASILLVNSNFGCGSSREHAPQAIVRWGIRAIVGESFAEIFFGNCVSLGAPCLVVSHDDVEKLMAACEADPGEEFRVDLESLEVSTSSLTVDARMPAGVREAFLRGTWDATGLLLEQPGEVDAVAASLPYTSGFEA